MIYMGDIGTLLRVDCGEDISSGASFEIKYRKPDALKTTGSWVGTLSGTDIVQYAIQDGDLDVKGTWRVQAEITVSAAEVYHSTIGEISVSPALDSII